MMQEKEPYLVPLQEVYWTDSSACLFCLGQRSRDIQDNKIQSKEFPRIIKVLLFQGFAFCISGLILVLFQLVDSLHLYSLLRQSGIDEVAAKEWKGVYDRGQPLLQLGTVVANSLSLSMVPLVSSYVKKNLELELISKIKLALACECHRSWSGRNCRAHLFD